VTNGDECTEAALVGLQQAIADRTFCEFVLTLRA